jgi:hypothetical protein
VCGVAVAPLTQPPDANSSHGECGGESVFGEIDRVLPDPHIGLDPNDLPMGGKTNRTLWRRQYGHANPLGPCQRCRPSEYMVVLKIAVALGG